MVAADVVQQRRVGLSAVNVVYARTPIPAVKREKPCPPAFFSSHDYVKFRE
jgi:hypothetical protein